jgi:hypothetical protein
MLTKVLFFLAFWLFSGTLSFAQAPRVLKVKPVWADASFTLTWQDHSTNEHGFIVERRQGPAPAPFTEVARPPANATTYNEAAPTVGQEYCYRVRSFIGATKSPPSNTACATMPEVPASPSNLMLQMTIAAGVEGAQSITITPTVTIVPGTPAPPAPAAAVQAPVLLPSQPEAEEAEEPEESQDEE